MANKTYFKGNNKKRKNTKKYQFAGFDESMQIDNTGYLNALYNPNYYDAPTVSNETIQKNIDQTLNTSRQSSADYTLAKQANNQSLLNLTASKKEAEEAEKASMQQMADKTKQEYTAKNLSVISGLSTQAAKYGLDLAAKKAAEKTAQEVGQAAGAQIIKTGANIKAGQTAGQAALSGTNLLYSGLGAAGVVGGEAWKYFSDDKNPYTYKPSEAAGTIGGNTLSWAGTGAGIGTAIMPGLGTLIGAGGGALGGLTVGLIQNKKKKKLAASLESERSQQEADWNAQKAKYDKYLEQGQRVYDYNQNLTRTGMSTLAEQARQNRLMQLTEGQLAGNTNIAMTGGGRKYFGKGGAKVPGGKVVPIGQGAVEFVGRSHAKGGIMLDSQTEVEGGETMDKVRMKNGKMNDYFFSKFLKYKGKSFAQHHKELIKRGASQKEIQALAKKQEAMANRKGEKDRSPSQVAEYGGIKRYQTAGPDKTVGPAGLTLEEAKNLANEVHMPIKMTADAAKKWEKVGEIGTHPVKKTLVNGVWVADSSPLIHEFDLKSEELLKTFVNPEDAEIAKYPVFRYGNRYLDAVSYSQIGLRDQDRKLPYFTSVPPAQIPSDFRPFNNIVGNTAAYYEYPHMMTGKETDEEKLIRAVNMLKYDTGYIKNTDYSDEERINEMAEKENWSPEFTKKVLDYKGKPIIQNPVMYVGIPQDDRNFDQKYGPSTWVKSNKLGGIKKYQTGNFLGEEIENSNSTNSIYWNNQNINTEEETPSKSQTLDTLDAVKEADGVYRVRDAQGNILAESSDKNVAEKRAQNVVIANQNKNESTTQKGNTAVPSSSKFGPYKNVNILNHFGALGRSVTNSNQVPYPKGMNAAAYSNVKPKAQQNSTPTTSPNYFSFRNFLDYQEEQAAADAGMAPLNTIESTPAAKTVPANSKFGPYTNFSAYKVPNNFGALGFKSNAADNSKGKEKEKEKEKEDKYSKMYTPEQIKAAKILFGIGAGAQFVSPIASYFMKPKLISEPERVKASMIDEASARALPKMISAGKVEAPRLGRVAPDTQDILNRDVANRQALFNIGDPSSMIAMIASTGKTNEAERKAIADAQRTNVELAGKEGMLKFEASKANVASSLEAQRANQAAVSEAQGRYLNILAKNREMENQAYLANLDAQTRTRLANAQLLADKQNRDIRATTAFGGNAAGVVGDILGYGMEGSKAGVISGDTEVYERNFIPLFGTNKSKTGGVKKKMYGGTNSYTSRLGELKFKRPLKAK